MHSIRSTISTTLKASPGALHSPKKCSSMFLSLWNDKPSCEIQKPWSFLKTKQQCINYDFYVGQCVFKYDQTIKGKQTLKYSSPYEIVHVHVNGTITIHLWPGVTEQINICCTIPYQDHLYNWWISNNRGECSAHECITLVSITKFLGIPIFLVPLNAYYFIFLNKW